MINQYPQANNSTTTLIWRKTMAGGETSLSGYDDSSVTLSYSPGQEQVYLNGILLQRGSDYTATNGTSITGLSALAASDVLQVNCYNNFNLTTSVPAANIYGTIANNQLANSSISINGNAISLGGSVSSLATLTGSETLTNKTIAFGSNTVSGTLSEFNSAVTDANLVSIDGSETLTNKTLTSPSITNASLSGTTSIWQTVENATISATAANGTINYDILTNGAVTYYTSNASGNWTLNLRGDGSNTFNSLLSSGKSLTIAFLVTNGATPYYHTGLQVDGVSVTPKWQGGVAPAAGNANSVDAYTFTIFKTGNATYLAIAAQVKFG